METLTQLWLYNDWANQAIIRLFEEHTTKMPAKCLHLFSHIVNTQTVWLGRMNGSVQTLGAWDDHSIETCKLMHQAATAGLKEQLNLPSNRLAEVIEYKNSLGHQYQNTKHEILIHVFNHGTYHRAQIATEMRENGLEPLNTDYITFVRE